MANIRINGVEIYYEIRGSIKAEENIMFLNGVMATTGSWDQLATPFEDKAYKIILHDFRGQLKSEKPKQAWTFDDHVEDMLELMNELNIEKAHLIGTSYGGEVALHFAVKYPERTSSITIIDSVSELSPLLEASVGSWIDAAAFKDGKAFYRLLLPWLYSSSFLKSNKEMLKFREEKMSQIPEEYFDGQINLYETFLTINITEKLNKISCPALIICGENDILKPPAFSRIISANIKNSELIILPDCGHVAIFEKVDELISIISGFLGKI